jgi:hypothetical protein
MNIALRDLTPAERVDVQQRFESLASKRFAPSARRPRFEVWWPKAPLDARAFPQGIHPADGDDAFNEAARLIGFLNGAGGGEFYIANLSAPKPHFRHTGKLDDELVRWIRTRLVSNPTVLLASNADLLLITDTHMHYSVVGGTSEIIDQFERRFGGAAGLRQNFANYVAQMRVGEGLDDAKWAEDYLQKWSGWV